MQRGERRLNAVALVFGDQAGKHLAEMRVLGARMDVLPAVGPEEGGLDCLHLGRVDRTAASPREVAGVGFGLNLQDAIHRGDQFDEVIDAPVALLRGQPGIVTYPLELVDDRLFVVSDARLEEGQLPQQPSLPRLPDPVAVHR